ncbi:YcaO-like family protein [Tateyamaria sp. SN3-11]|uniref:YcaO-like family protein n=1 Tax=Tateyamaria sp. SN3-11 TaxID=3092147 RepID=UPI0039E8EB11
MHTLDYLFYGQCKDAPNLIFAGGLTENGTPVSGAGQTLASAFTRLCGEAGEQRAVRNCDLTPFPGGNRLDGAAAHGPETACVLASYLPDGVPIGVPRVKIRDEGSRTPAPSEGLGAGPDYVSAALHGALELVERRVVKAWWRGTLHARHLHASATQQMVRDTLGHPRTRHTHILVLTSCETFCAIVAVSFLATGKGFCFGAAARSTMHQAVQAALRELAQAEVGLALSQMKLREYGPSKLLPGELADLALATEVDEEIFLRDLTSGSCSNCFEDTEPSSPSRNRLLELADLLSGLVICDLGSPLDGLHVCKAFLLSDVHEWPFPNNVLLKRKSEYLTTYGGMELY